MAKKLITAHQSLILVNYQHQNKGNNKMKNILYVLFLSASQLALSGNLQFDQEFIDCANNGNRYIVSITSENDDFAQSDSIRISSGCDWRSISGESQDWGYESVKTEREYVININDSGQDTIVLVKFNTTGIVGTKEHNGFKDFPITESFSGNKLFTMEGDHGSFDFEVPGYHVKFVIRKDIKTVSNGKS